MKVNRRKAEFLKKTIKTWQSEGVLDEEQARKLQDHVNETPFDWNKLAQYAFWIAVFCFVIAIGALVADKVLMDVITAFLEQIFNAPDRIKALTFALLSAGLYYFAWSRNKKKPHLEYSNEVYFLMGVFTTIISVLFLHSSLDFSPAYLNLVFIFLAAVYFLVGWLCNSRVVWIFALLALGGWMGVETGYRQEWTEYFLGMNYPLRYVIFGFILTVTGQSMRHVPAFKPYYKGTYVLGLAYLFISLWIVSITGNYSSFSEWVDVPQIRFIGWSLLLAGVSVVAILYGIKFDDRPTRGFGIIFLLINLYTRYIEYVWGSLHIAAFFAILAVSFWLIGTKAEQIWYLGERNKA